MHVFAYKTHTVVFSFFFFNSLSPEHMDIPSYRCALFVWSICHQQSSVHTHSKVISHQLSHKQMRMFLKLETFTWDDWQCQHSCFVCAAYSCKLPSSSSINTCKTTQQLVIMCQSHCLNFHVLYESVFLLRTPSILLSPSDPKVCCLNAFMAIFN